MCLISFIFHCPVLCTVVSCFLILLAKSFCLFSIDYSKFHCSSSDSDSESEPEMKWTEPKQRKKKKKHKKSKQKGSPADGKKESEHGKDRPKSDSVSTFNIVSRSIFSQQTHIQSHYSPTSGEKYSYPKQVWNNIVSMTCIKFWLFRTQHENGYS